MILLGALVVVYAALSYYGGTHPGARALGAALSIGPVLLIALVLAWRWASPPVALLGAAGVGALLWRYWPVVERHFEWADLAQQCGAYALVAVGFTRSLSTGRVPLCEQLAVKMHGALAPIEIAYLRRATIAWAFFYLALAGAILGVYFMAPLRLWSLFVNFGTFGLIFLAGLADHALRRRVLPRHPGGGILAVIRQTLIG